MDDPTTFIPSPDHSILRFRERRSWDWFSMPDHLWHFETSNSMSCAVCKDGFGWTRVHGCQWVKKHWDVWIYNISTRFSWFSGSFRLVVRPFHVASKRIKGVFSLMGCFICYFSSSEMNSPDMCMFYFVLLFSVIPWLNDFSFRVKSRFCSVQCALPCITPRKKKDIYIYKSNSPLFFDVTLWLTNMWQWNITHSWIIFSLRCSLTLFGDFYGFPKF